MFGLAVGCAVVSGIGFQCRLHTALAEPPLAPLAEASSAVVPHAPPKVAELTSLGCRSLWRS